MLLTRHADEITAWMQMLAPHGHPARRWEPTALRLRLSTIAATLARSDRRVRLHLAARSPFAELASSALARLGALAPG